MFYKSIRFCKSIVFSIVATLFLSPVVFAETKDNSVLVVKMRKTIYKDEMEQRNNYKYKLLELLLDKTESEYGEYKIALTEIPTQGRVITDVIDGRLDIIMTVTSREREISMIPIRIPIYKGLYGYRIFLINRSDQYKFDAVETEDDLKKLIAGQGSHWPDYKILEANGYRVAGTSEHALLYSMLKAKRFDYFPRGVHEPWLELKQHPDSDFIVEQKLCIAYPSPGYIFVTPKNKKLAERLEKGFMIAIADGSFDQLFFTHPDIKETLDRAQLGKRKIFYLENPLLSRETPLSIEKLWYRP